MSFNHEDKIAVEKIKSAAKEISFDLKGGRLRRTSSRLCLAVEHGDYNGTDLLGVGTDRFIWFGFKPRFDGKFRLFSMNFPEEGVVEFQSGDVPEPKSPVISSVWGRFPYGVEYILRREGLQLKNGLEGIIYGNIPGGGMSRSASLTLNLMLAVLDVNRIEVEDPFKIVDMAQAVENDYIGSPCGNLDQIMILFARDEAAVYYNPHLKKIEYVSLGPIKEDFLFAVMDTGTDRPGLESSTYITRRKECEELVSILNRSGYSLKYLAEIKEKTLYDEICKIFRQQYPSLCRRLKYIFQAQQRFPLMLKAWEAGDIRTVGKLFRQDGLGLRDDYEISGPELETMCDIARTVPGVQGERMLGGGDKGAAGAIVLASQVDELRRAVDTAYPRSHPDYASKYAVHTCRIVKGVEVFEGRF